MTFHPISAIADMFLAALSSLFISRLLRLPASRAIRLIVGIVFFATLVVVPVHILGALQLFGAVRAVSVPGALLIEMAIFAIVATIYWFRRNGLNPPSLQDIPSWRDLPGYALLATSVLLSGYAVFQLDLLTSYPSGWDGLVYHLPLALRWLQTGSLQMPPTQEFQFSMPGNFEIGMMVLLDTGWQALAPLYNLPFLALLLTSTHAIARQLGSNRQVAFLAVFSVASLPIIIFQGSSTYVDLSGAACITAAIALFLQAHSARESAATFWTLVAAAGLACGIAVGTKAIFYPYAALVLAVGTIVVMARRFDRRRLAVVILVLVTGVAVPSAFWFWRAVHTTGNPVYPLRVAVGDHVFLPGLKTEDITPNNVQQIHASSLLAFLTYPWTEKKLSREGTTGITPYSVDSGFGGVFASFATVGVLFCIWLLVKRQLQRATIIVLLVFLSAAVFWWFALRRYPRFGLLLWIIACLLACPLYEALTRANSRLFRVVFVSSIALTCGVASFQPLARIAHRVLRHEYTRAAYYSYPPIIDRLPAGARVLNRANEFNFTLAGARLSNRVVPWFEAPHEITAGYLREIGVDYVVESASAHKEALDLTPIGARLIYDDSIRSGFDGALVEWHVWRVAPNGPAVPARLSRAATGTTPQNN